MQDDKKVAFPGDMIATTEEYLPGKNTEEKNGEIIAVKFGQIIRDDINLLISVDTQKKEFTLKKGDIVYGQVVKGEQHRYIVRIVGAFQKGLGLREIDEEMQLSLGIARRPQSDFIAIGDLIRGYVIRTGDFPEISINGNHYGVISAVCLRCRQPLVKRGITLYCENCQRTEIRKMADDYGNVDIFNYENRIQNQVKANGKRR
ncbi:hypothetical protein [Thermoplasma volcanium GSS1]|uniref:Exosome complex component Csl4 n=1 Tax=Thermoplasma volcanium (strain ATCC 51530 / DSM 4299 / JCM 9571 / NBRC 15438 / GSS1) TaxID=273116 RepID=Q979Q8_THEVO|nr:exosome complex RNA-binding protein Csl4 [Thermoplasma volcanium]BAB60244.1 hypothetical protein [Thermoplasma volcanium GSS1]